MKSRISEILRRTLASVQRDWGLKKDDPAAVDLRGRAESKINEIESLEIRGLAEQKDMLTEQRVVSDSEKIEPV